MASIFSHNSALIAASAAMGIEIYGARVSTSGVVLDTAGNGLTTLVPEPATLGLLAIASLCMGAYALRRRRRS